MRMRPKKNREARMEKVEHLFMPKNEEGFIDIGSAFNENGGIFLEIGCGKGSFIEGLSAIYPEKRLVAMELVPDVLMMAMERVSRAGSENVRFICGNAESISQLVPSGSVDRLYLNFSDPWPKKRNAKRRLTSPMFLQEYKKILAPEGKIFFKTDNKGLFDYSLETLNACGYEITEVCFDLHSDPVLASENIETEYERNFSAKGFKINYLSAVLR